MLKAYARLGADPREWPLIMLGDGLAERSFAYDSEKKIQGVQMPGFVSESERHRYTQEAKWMVTPSHTNEDLGLTPLEARTVGVPCIASTDGGLKETAGTHAPLQPRRHRFAPSLSKGGRKNEETEYAEKVNLTKKGLEDYVRPLNEYPENYLKLLTPFSK